MGDMLHADMFSNKKPEFGRPLVSSISEVDYQDLLKGRAKHQQKHPEFYAVLKNTTAMRRT
jgi:hypothetical protein